MQGTLGKNSESSYLFKCSKGKTPAENEEVYRNKISFPELEKMQLRIGELAAKYDIIDFESGIK